MTKKSRLVRSDILVAEDDPLFIDVLRRALKDEPIEIVWVQTAAEALKKLKSGGPFATVIFDQHLPDINGNELAKIVKRQFPNQKIIFATGDFTEHTLTELLQAGVAIGFIPKGTGGSAEVRAPIVKAIFEYQIENRLLDAEEEAVDRDVQRLFELNIVGRSRPMREILRKIEIYHRLPLATLILGESGSGKELIANALAAGTGLGIIPINCATFEGREHMMEAELFGVVKGAFTGADHSRPGVFESARGRTIFLDEIHCLTRSAQSKLLRVLNDKKVIRVGDGSATQHQCDFKVIAAGKPELLEMLGNGSFKKDLFYRISLYQILVPSLRERIEDIEPLIYHFERLMQRRHKMHKRFRPATIRLMEQHPWLGEARELESMVERLFGESKGDMIEPRDFLQSVAGQFDAKNVSIPSADDEVGYEICLRAFEAEYLKRILAKFATQKEAATFAKISPSTLSGRLKALGINTDEYLKKTIKPQQNHIDGEGKNGCN